MKKVLSLDGLVKCSFRYDKGAMDKRRAKDMLDFNGQVVYRVYSSRPYEVYRNEYI